MNDERVVDDIVTEFLVNTCLLRPQLTRPAVQSAMLCSVVSAQHPDDDAEADMIPLTTGSAAEFYIKPMLPHIGDVDVMCHVSTQLAIPRGHPPPTQLPDEFHNYVRVFEIIDSHFPGYVYLDLRYLLTESVDEDKYNAVPYDEQMYLENICDRSDLHGPAVTQPPSKRLQNLKLPLDAVPCVRCLVWPPQAADWPSRHRNYGWPDSQTIDRVVGNGCHTVGVAHRQCRQYEWMNKHQCRLSFSRAEIILINSWMPVQQIVYHMLRVVIKSERFTDSVDNSGAGTLSNYHIKTLMLWACELKPAMWWTDDVNLVRICVELLHDLVVWLAEARCPHYFIHNCNLVDSSFNLETIRSGLSITKSWLSSWFVNNYIGKCSQLCPHDVSRLFDDVSSTRKLKNAVSAVIDWRLNSDTLLCDMWKVFNLTKNNLACIVSNFSLTAQSLARWLTELRDISTSLRVHFLSVAFLHVAYKMSRNGLDDELMDVVAVLCGQSVGPRRHFSRRSSVLLLRKTANLMKAVVNTSKSRSTGQLLAIELSQAYLHKTLSCKDSDSDSIYCLANVYLAALFYTSGQYPMAIDHCTRVMRSQDHSQCSSHVVQGELLPKTDDDTDIALGLAVFYQHVRMAALNQQQQTYVTVFTTELFAHYLHIKCLSVTKCQQLSDTTNSQSSTYEVHSYLKNIADMPQLFVADVLLWKLLNAENKSVYKQRRYPTSYPSEPNTSDLVELLQKSAFEHMTRFRQMEALDFGSVVTVVTTVFEALYAYKRGDYRQCLQLSTQNVRLLLYAECINDVPTFPEFIQLFDDDIVSLTALTLIVNPECRTARKANSGYAYVTQLTLSLYLMTHCQLKLRRSVTSLAETLDYIRMAYFRHLVDNTLDRLTLKMIAHKSLTYVKQCDKYRC